jgi:hypothetical protein
MATDVRSQKTMIAALDRKLLFNSPQWGVPTFEREAMKEPNQAGTGRAVANIRVWRKYLPQACVAAMIKDGWQWST